MSDLVCEVCNEVLSSRNKLFDHIKKTGHAAIKSADSTIADNSQNSGQQAKTKRSKNKKR